MISGGRGSFDRQEELKRRRIEYTSDGEVKFSGEWYGELENEAEEQFDRTASDKIT